MGTPLISDRLRSRIAAGLARVYLDALRSGRHPQYILILGHMRSGSTLLNHILVSHPEINGFGELNRTYQSAVDLYRLAWEDIRQSPRPSTRTRYLVDQLNHSRLLADERLLRQPGVVPIFLLREPHSAIASITRLFTRFYGKGKSDAVEYYIERLETLGRYATTLAGDTGRHFTLTYHDLTGRTAETLLGLSRYLALGSPLSEQYESFDFTGVRGDPFERIKSGTVLPPADSGSTLTPPQSDMLEMLYRDTLEKLRAA